MITDNFEKVILELSPNAWQMWVDKCGWYLPGEYALQVWIKENEARVSPHGFGAMEYLIAKTEEELKECIMIWRRNRN